MGILQPGDKLSRGLSAKNYVMLSMDGARELRDMIDRAIAEHAAGVADQVREAHIAKHGKAPVTAAQFHIDNLNVVIYDEDTDPQIVAEAMVKHVYADAMEAIAQIRKDAAPRGNSLN